MSSYGAFVAASGFKYHGPKGEISFSPKINQENYRSAFIAAEGWGSFSQMQSGDTQTNSLELAYGQLMLNQFEVSVSGEQIIQAVEVRLEGELVETKFKQKEQGVVIYMPGIEMAKGQKLMINLQ